LIVDELEVALGDVKTEEMGNMAIAYEAANTPQIS
jgi:hypothetical protein